MGAIDPSLLALDHLVFHPVGMSGPLRHSLDASRTGLVLHASLALNMLRALTLNCSKALLLALHPLWTLDSRRLALRGPALLRLGTLRRSPLAFNLIGITVITAWASRSRRRNRQRRHTGSEE